MKNLTLYALAAAFTSTGGAFMKYSHGLTKLFPTRCASSGFSSPAALLQAWAMKQEALGPSYVVVLGLEAMLAVVAGNVIFGEPISAKLLAGFLAAGITLLRLTDRIESNRRPGRVRRLADCASPVFIFARR